MYTAEFDGFGSGGWLLAPNVDSSSLNPIPMDANRLHVLPVLMPVQNIVVAWESVLMGSLLKQQTTALFDHQESLSLGSASIESCIPDRDYTVGCSQVLPSVAISVLNDVILSTPLMSSSEVVMVSKKNNNNKSDKEDCTWMLRYKELVVFQIKHGHVNVPYNYPENPPLAQWTKRQRHQKKLFDDDRHSNLNEGRLTLLEATNFAWDSRQVHWLDRLYELSRFKRDRGHLKISKTKKEERPLSVWLKRQRHQARLYLKGETEGCNMTSERFSMLLAEGVEFNG